MARGSQAGLSQFDQKYSHQEDEGLQVTSYYEPHQEQAGLQVWHPEGQPPGYNKAPFASALSPTGKEPYVAAQALSPEPDCAAGQKDSKRRRRWWILGGVIGGILILVAIIVAAVLATRKTDSTPPPPAPTQSPATSTDSSGNDVGRDRSTKGAWNGTGIATVYAHRSGFWAWMFYQDYTGAIQAAQHTRPSNLDITIRQTFPVNIQAANGSALAANRYNDTGSDFIHLVYVNRQNILSDAWLDENLLNPQGDFADSNNKTPWTDGDLSKLGFTVPTDNRAGMSMYVDPVWFGKNRGDGGAKLVVGGSDGLLHQLVYDRGSKSWSPDTYTFDNSYAYSGIQIRASGAGIKNWNTTIYTATQDGSLQYRVQPNSHPNNDTGFPLGGTWQTPFTADVKAAVNSSFAMSWDADVVLFPDAQGRMGVMCLDMNVATGSQFDQYSTRFQQLDAMPGTDMTFDSLDGKPLTFYQPHGGMIAFRVFNVQATNMTNNGVVVS